MPGQSLLTCVTAIDDSMTWRASGTLE